MHDRNSKELKVGDLVLIPGVIKEIFSVGDYCNVTVESFYGRRPDGVRERISAINTAVMVRANVGDELISEVDTKLMAEVT